MLPKRSRTAFGSWVYLGTFFDPHGDLTIYINRSRQVQVGVVTGSANPANFITWSISASGGGYASGASASRAGRVTRIDGRPGNVDESRCGIFPVCGFPCESVTTIHISASAGATQSLDGFNIFAPAIEGGNAAVRAEVWYWKDIRDFSQPWASTDYF
jgi:hypothetical protein